MNCINVTYFFFQGNNAIKLRTSNNTYDHGLLMRIRLSKHRMVLNALSDIVRPQSWSWK